MSVNGLTDMEELLARISNKSIVDYMREALSCYNAGATRGCIVMSYLALFDDLRQKLRELAQVNSTARTISESVELRANSQEIFENYMAAQLRSVGLINEADAELLEQVRIRRNKAAHPSGIHASPEEARFVYFEVIDKFLSKQVLKTTHAVDALIERLLNSNLFPNRSMPDIAAIVSHEIADLHPSAMVQLVKKCASKCDDADSTTSQNAQFFLTGLSYSQRGNQNHDVQKFVIEQKSDNSTNAEFLCRIVAANPSLLVGLTPPVRLRMQSLLAKVLAETDSSIATTRLLHPANLLTNSLKYLGEDFLLLEYEQWLDGVLEKYMYTPSLVLAAQAFQKISTKLVALYVREAGSSTFDIANKFARNIPDLDDLVAPILSPEKAFELLVAVDRSASNGAWSTRDLRAAEYKAIPKIRQLALTYAESEAENLAEILERQYFYGTLAEFIATLDTSKTLTV
jgi:hypothetical protein